MMEEMTLQNERLKRKIKAVYGALRRIGLKNKEFSIISNNCWGGLVYDAFHMRYLTPTIGLWIPSDDYIRFLSNLEHYLSIDIYQISYSECHAKNILIERKKKGIYQDRLEDLIIGRLDDVDIIFLHYANFKDAKDKWDRRKKRINYDNLIVKYNDQNGFIPAFLDQYRNLPYKCKLFFSANENLVRIFGKGGFLFQERDKEGNVNDTVIDRQPFSIKQLLNDAWQKRENAL